MSRDGASEFQAWLDRGSPWPDPDGKRRCRICSRISQAAYRQRERAKKSA